MSLDPLAVINQLKRPFVEAMIPIARSIFAYAWIQPKIMIAQAAHESMWGTSALARKANNLFGIKAGSWIKKGKPVFPIPTREHSPHVPASIDFWEVPGDIVEKRPSEQGGTDLIVDCFFRLYEDWQESCADWAALIIKYYPQAYDGAREGNFLTFAQGLRGYATDPRYIEKICQYADEPLFQNIVV